MVARTAVAAAAAAIGFGCVASEAGAGLWSAPASLGPSGANTRGDVAVDGSGTVVVAWVADDGSVRAAVRPPGGVFPSATLLAPSGVGAPAVALDGAGNALVAWTEGNDTLGMAQRAPGAAGFTQIPTGVAGVEREPDVAFLAAGTAVVTWGGVDGAIHALSSSASRGIAALPDLSTDPGSLLPQLAAGDGLGVAAWTNSTQTTEQGNTRTTTRVQASMRPPDGAFAPPEDVATGSAVEIPAPPMRTGNGLSVGRLVVSGDGSADLLVDNVLFEGMPGELAIEGLVAVRPRGAGWTTAVRLSAGRAPSMGGWLAQGIAGSDDGEALYVAAESISAWPTITYYARSRASGSASYGEPITLMDGVTGEVQAAALASHRFVVLMRSGAALMSRSGGASGFDPLLRFTGTDATRLLAIDGAPNGRAVAAWTTTSGDVDVAIYDDRAGSLPPSAVRDTTAPRLTHLSISPSRFAVRRSARTASAHGTRIRWRLSEPARVVLRVDRVRGGFRHGSRCEAKRPRSGRARPCARFVRMGSFRRTAPAGATSLPFKGFLKGRALRRGSYRLTAIATDAARHTAKAKRARFAVARS